ncbi:MAG TPA: cupin domain-containing protein [Thermomonospora sp.]|nr:cupin domain-containing protein [Thermomonospora sp.]
MTTVLHLAGADQAALPAAGPKPTSLTGQQEATLELWAEGAASAGVWECGPGTFTAVRDGYHEVCQVLSGRATVRGETGAPVELGPGSAIVLPDGWRGTWEVHETLRKTYVMVPAR